MAMSRFMSQSLHRASLCSPIPISSHLRRRSSKTHHAQLIEVDLDAASSSQPDSAEAGAEVIAVGARKLEDAIHNIIVRRSAPDWLPFLPGYSYWVPPRSNFMRNHRGGNLIEVFDDFNSSSETTGGPLQDELSEDETMSLSSSRGWPSSAIFIEGTSPIHPISVMQVQDNEDNADDASKFEDTEE